MQMHQSILAWFSTKLVTHPHISSFLLGFLLVFSYAPFQLWPITIFVLSALLWLYSHAKITQPFKFGWVFGFGWFGSGISWVYVSIDHFGGLPIVVSILLMMLLCGYLALFPALAFYLADKLNRRFNTQQNALTFALFVCCCWPFTELLREYLLTGFPWLSLGYSQINSPIKVLAPIIGEYGLSFTLWLIASIILALIVQPIKKHALFSFFILSVLLFTVSQIRWTVSTDKEVNVLLVQGNIKQSLKWEPEQQWPTLLAYLELTRQHFDADLIIWPESAIPTIEPLALDILSSLNEEAQFHDTAIVTGIINYQQQSHRFFNSLIVLGKQFKDDTKPSYYYQSANRYNKHHLLPIGEFVPLQEWLRPIAPLFNLPMSSFTRGHYQQPNLMANGYQILPLICFEIAFAPQLRANFSPETQLLLTVSNDAWFGDSHGPHQHMEIAQMRALEFGRPLLRATNNGITAVVNEQGEIISQLPQFTRNALATKVNLVTGVTPFSQWGYWPTWLMAIVLCCLTVFIGKKKPQ
jgi:apolipoprotein N-acyltransferase